MKKLLLLTIAILTLIGCNKAINMPAEDMSTYTDEEYHISFNYPSSWEIDAQDRFVHAVGIFTGDNQESIFFDYQVDPGDFRNEFKNRDRVSMKETTFAGYPAEEYGMESSIKYLIEVEGRFVVVDSEFKFTQAQEEGVKEILNSLTQEDLPEESQALIQHNQIAELVAYDSDKYTFDYPRSYSIQEPTDSFAVLTVQGEQGKVEVFQMSDFGDRPFGFSGEEDSSGTDNYVPKETLTANGYDFWLYYGKDDLKTKEELDAIVSSFQLK